MITSFAMRNIGHTFVLKRGTFHAYAKSGKNLRMWGVSLLIGRMPRPGFRPPDNASFRRLAVEMLRGRLSLSLGRGVESVTMMGWTIESVELQWLVATIDYIVPRAGGNHNCVVAFDFGSLPSIQTSPFPFSTRKNWSVSRGLPRQFPLRAPKTSAPIEHAFPCRVRGGNRHFLRSASQYRRQSLSS